MSMIEKDPNDPWLRKHPLTDEQLTEEREKMVSFLVVEHGWCGDVKFTCDGCELAKTCTLVFDGYNTDGDCLLSK